MKKILLLLIPAIILAIITLPNANRNTLFLLNWGEYIDPELIVKFEEEFDVVVVMDEVGSSEDMYSKIYTNTTPYDVAIPGDYIIEKMYNEGLIQALDYSQIPNYHSDMFNDDLTEIRRSDFFKGNEDYAVPYFWGAYCLIYSTRNPNVEEVVRANGFDAIFNRNLYDSSSVRLAMYNVPRFATTAYLLTQNKDINTIEKTDLDGFVAASASARFSTWGNDNIKKEIATGNLDVGLVQLGDFFDQYYIALESNEEINFSCYVPDNTAIFFDGMVIPTTSRNTDLAYKFINFMLDPDNAFQNASFVGYTPPIKAVVQRIEESEDFTEMLEQYPFYVNPVAGKSAGIFRNIEQFSDGSDYQDYLELLINRAKS